MNSRLTPARSVCTATSVVGMSVAIERIVYSVGFS